MGKTYRQTPENPFRKPKRNGARKGEVRRKAVPPDSWDDIPFASREEDWFSRHRDVEEFDPDFKKRMKRLKKEGREMRKKDNYLNDSNYE